MICTGSNPGVHAENSAVSYKINCLGTPSGLAEDHGRCKYEYTGQTGRNGYTRGKKHIGGYVHTLFVSLEEALPSKT